MSAERDAMIAELAPLEAAVQALATARATYHANYLIASAAAAAAAPTRQTTLEVTVGPAVLDTLVLQRLRALGVVFDHARLAGVNPSGPLPATFVDELTAKITGLVP